MALSNYVRLQRLLQVYVTRHPELADASKILCMALDRFDYAMNIQLMRNYFGLIQSYQQCLKHINFTKEELDLLLEILMDLQFEIALKLTEKQHASHSHSQN